MRLGLDAMLLLSDFLKREAFRLVISKCWLAAQDAKRHGHQVAEVLLRTNGGILSSEPGIEQIRQVFTLSRSQRIILLTSDSSGARIKAENRR